MIRSKVSKRYAKALLSLGKEDGNFEKYSRELRDFSNFYTEFEEFRQVIANQVFPVEERRKVLQVVLEKGIFSDMVKKFFNLLLDKNRIGSIEAITSHYERLTDEISNIARAEIVTPRPLKADARSRLTKALESLTAKTVKVELKEDPNLIGGIIVRVGDWVLDGSVRAQLDGLRESLKRDGHSQWK